VEITHSKIEVVPERKPTSILIQIFLVVNLLAPVYTGFFDFTYEKIVILGLSIIFLISCLWYLRESFSWTDLIIGIVLATGLLYSRFLTQRGYVSLLYSAPFFITGFSLAILFKYSLIPRRTFLIYTTLALLPFLHAFFFKGIRLDGQGTLYAINRNSIPMRLIIATSLQVMNDCLQKRKYIIIFPSILTLVCAYYSNSRAGLLVAGLLFYIVLLSNILNKRQAWMKEHKGKAFILIVLFICITIVGGYFVIQDTRLVSVGLEDPARKALIVEFLKQLTFRKLLTGFQPTLHYGLHSHSSYQTMVTYYGISAFVIFYLILVSLLHYRKHSLVLFGLLGVWCVYSLVENLSPGFIGDFLLIPLLMVALYQKGTEFLPSKKKPMQLVRRMFGIESSNEM